MMSNKISNSVDVFHFSPTLAVHEHNWAYFFSYLLSFDLTDIPPPPLLACGPEASAAQPASPLSVFQRFQG